jgi:hypothetical protein
MPARVRARRRGRRQSTAPRRSETMRFCDQEAAVEVRVDLLRCNPDS